MYNIPEKILIVLQQIENAGFESFLVGGSVRDLIMEKEPKDWDITTSAKPEEILNIFPDGKYENNFGTIILPEKYIAPSNLQINYESTNNTNNKQQGQKSKVLSNSVKLNTETKDKLIDVAKGYLQKKECPTQVLKHTKKTIETANKIAETYKDINSNILEILVWFHDTGKAIGPIEQHTKNSQKIIKKELVQFYSKKDIDTIAEAICHKHNEKSLSLEQQILKEADAIEGLNIERIQAIENIEEVKVHSKWVKKNFTSQEIYKHFITDKGKTLMEEAVDNFNKESFEVDAEIPNWDNIGNVEITTYRIESTYSDNRRPDEVEFAETLEEDIGRRDFTCNAIALQVKKDGYKIIDLYEGQQDIKNQVIRAVGDASERFNEDALRMMRAVRFAAQLSTGDDLQFLKDRKKDGNQNQKAEYEILHQKKPGDLNSDKLNKERWWIGENTFDALKKNANLLKHISPERISEEFQKIILSNRPAWGIELLVETGLMKHIIPELYDTIGVRQNRHHYYGPFNTVYKHMLAALATCPSRKIEVKLAAFFHDIGKPKSKRGRGYESTFYGHEYIGARMTKEIMERLKFPRKVIDKTVLLVENHMFYYNTEEVGEKGVRKVIRKVGLENINDLIDVRIGDRLGSGVAKAIPYKLRHFKYMVEKVSNDPISVKDLKINGDILLAEYNFKPGPQMGAILEILLAEVLDDPKLNTIEYLADRAIELQKEDLKQLRQLAKQKIKEEKQEEESQTKGKYWVK